MKPRIVVHRNGREVKVRKCCILFSLAAVCFFSMPHFNDVEMAFI